MQWLSNNNIPTLCQQIRYKDNNGTIHIGIFDMLNEYWHVTDLVGSIITHWRDVIEWQGFNDVSGSLQYQNFLIASIESELE